MARLLLEGTRMHNPIDDQAESPLPDPTESPSAAVHPAARVAGGVFLLTGVIAALTLCLGFGRPISPAAILIPSTMIDVLIGMSLLRGSVRWRGLAIVRVIGGMLLWGGAAIVRNDTISIVSVVVYCSAALLLLIGRPGRARFAVGVVGMSLYLGVTALALVETARFRFGASKLAQASEVKGRVVPYRLRMPSSDWLLMSDEKTLALNATADRALIHRMGDAHALIFADRVPSDIKVQELVAASRAGLEKKGGTTEPDEVLSGATDDRRVYRGQLTQFGIPFHYRVGALIARGYAIEIFTWTTADAIPAMESEMLELIRSIEAPSEPAPDSER